jgi:hypothetical protein
MIDQSDSRPLQVTTSNGVTWTRQPGGTSSKAQLLDALSISTRMNTDVALLWNWWEEDRHDREHDRVWGVLREWDNGAPRRKQSDEEVEAFVRNWQEESDRRFAEERAHREHLVATSYDEARANSRLQLLRTEADAAFFQHVIEAPASSAQRQAAERRLEKSQAAASTLRNKVGEPDDVLDEQGYLPAERRSLNLSSHMRYWRYDALRLLHKHDRRRFTTLLGMPVPDASDLCSECQAPAQWHEYDLSLCLFKPSPPAGSKAETLARLMPGWWERCSACTAYRIEHVWGGEHALPDFTGEQWRVMLPPVPRAVFAPDSPKKRKSPAPKPQPLATVPAGPIADVTARLAELQAQYPTAEVRQGSRGQWELWPPTVDGQG